MSDAITVADAVRAQAALRRAAGLSDETFTVEAFVGMVSDEIEALRNQGRNDDEIAAIVKDGAAVPVSGAEISKYYAGPEERGKRP